MAQTLTTVTLTWTETSRLPGSTQPVHEFEARDGADLYKAYRCRSPYGWSWWSITKNGEPSSINSGRQTELPRSFQAWR